MRSFEEALCELNQNKEALLMYKDDVVAEVNLALRSIKVISYEKLPFSMKDSYELYQNFIQFCSNRVLMYNRIHSKEILLKCGLDDQSDINICLTCNGLSFRDNYWFKQRNSKLTWADINLYDNELNLDISIIALLGGCVSDQLSNTSQIMTGELTAKGTRAKGYFREGNEIILRKHQTEREINSEILSYIIAQIVNISSTKYKAVKYQDKICSECSILTSKVNELLPCRDIMTHYSEHTTGINMQTYKYFMQCDIYNFIRMQVFDFLTLNIDRNRDNYGLLVNDNKVISLFPLFDHDSCFKGKSIKALYFVTGLTFEGTLSYLKSLPEYKTVMADIKLNTQVIYSEKFKNTFIRLLDEVTYKEFISRFEML